MFKYFPTNYVWNLSVDLAYGLLNPRIRHASGR